MPFAHRHLELRQIGLIQIALRRRGIETVTIRFRAAVDREMFRARHRQHVIRVVALQSLDERHAKRAAQERVFAVGFLAAAPARVAEDVDVRRPERQPAEPFGVAVVFGGVIVELRAAFNADDVCFLMKQRRIPRGRHADGLRENRRIAVVWPRRATPRSNNCMPARPSRRMAGAPFCNCATFSASDMRRIKSFSRAANGCDGSRQIGGSLISGMRMAAAEYGSASSDALNETTDSPEAFFTSNVLNFALSLLAVKVTVSGP